MQVINFFLKIILLTLIPTFELRAAIPYAFFAVSNLTLGWLYGSIVAIIINILLGPIVYFIIDKFINLLRKIKIINTLYEKKVAHIQKNIKPKVEKYGPFALALFIGIPFPGTGSYTGALAAYLLGIKQRKFFWINLVGVVIAGTLVCLIMLSGKAIF